jgi:hypothetical protein
MNNDSVSTTQCEKFRHPEFRLTVDSYIPRIDIGVLVSFLEESVENGSRFADGETISFGSMLLRVASIDGSFSLEEPDLKSLPIVWKNGVTQSLKLLRLQKDIAESVGLNEEVDPPSIRCSLLVAADMTQDCQAFVLERTSPVQSDSGWFIGRLDTQLDYRNSANLNRQSVYQAILNWPQIAGFLALPAGCRVDVSLAKTLFSRNGEPLGIKKGGFVDFLEEDVDRRTA